MKPIFGLNHQWAMARGLESLELELARRHAPNEAAKEMLPPPPGPTTTSTIPLMLGTAAVVLFGLWVILSLRRRDRAPEGVTLQAKK